MGTIEGIESKLFLPSPLQKISLPGINLDLYIKRDDLIHPLISGNKWRKLKYLLIDAAHKGLDQWVSFGGAFSNHLCALGTIAEWSQKKLSCFVRGEPHFLSNPTLTRLKKQGAIIKFVPRHAFREFLSTYQSSSKNELIIPEGGSQSKSNLGVREMMTEISAEIDISSLHSIWVSCGSGGTIAGMLKDLPPNVDLHGVCAVRDLSLPAKISEIASLPIPVNCKLIFPRKRFGYGRLDDEDRDIMRNILKHSDVVLDPIYMVKLFRELYDHYNNGKIPENSRVLIIHTGGLQGIEGYEYIHQEKIYE